MLKFIVPSNTYMSCMCACLVEACDIASNWQYEAKAMKYTKYISLIASRCPSSDATRHRSGIGPGKHVRASLNGEYSLAQLSLYFICTQINVELERSRGICNVCNSRRRRAVRPCALADLANWRIGESTTNRRPPTDSLRISSASEPTRAHRTTTFFVFLLFASRSVIVASITV